MNWLHNLQSLSQNELIEEVRKISTKQRCMLWIRCSGAEALKREAEQTYDELVHSFEKNENVLEEYVLIQIRKDINRSGLSDSEKVDTLERILCAYAIRNHKVGYAQGMNFLVARCLTSGVEEEDTFWILSALVENVLKDYFDESLTGVMVDCKVCLELLKMYRPRLYDMFSKHDIQITGEVSSMIMTMFDNFIPSESVCIIWDLIFLIRFERFAFAILLVYFQNCEIFAPTRLLHDDESEEEKSSEDVSSSSSSSSSFQEHGAGFGLEMLLMQTMRKWRTMNENDVIRMIIRPALCLVRSSCSSARISIVLLSASLSPNTSFILLHSQ